MKAKNYILMGIVGAGAAIAGFVAAKLLSDRKAKQLKESADSAIDEEDDDFDFGSIDENSKA